LAAEKGIIFDVERFAIYDGPGIRTTVFFKGCPMRCAWCQNPEGMSPEQEVLFREHLCVLCGRCVAACLHGAHEVLGRSHVFHRERCQAARLCALACPTGALAVAGREATVDEVMETVLRDRVFYEKSGGGITLSGGEALMQAGFAKALLAAARSQGLHTALDTCGFLPWAAFQGVLELVDLFLYDVKDTDPARHRQNTGADLDLILDNLRRLDAAGAKIRIRSIIVPGVNDTIEHFEMLSEIERSLRGLEKMEILPYHGLGLPKWKALGRNAPNFTSRT